MKINTKVRYGLKALAYIAENSSEKKLVRIKEISEDQDIYQFNILNKFFLN